MSIDRKGLHYLWKNLGSCNLLNAEVCSIYNFQQFTVYIVNKQITYVTYIMPTMHGTLPPFSFSLTVDQVKRSFTFP